MTFLNRYRQGERRQVWGELIAVGDAVRKPPLADDARGVATETIERIRHNLDLIYQRLLRIGFEFADPTRALVYAGTDAVSRVSALEETYGSLPIIGEVWYETFESVVFVQSDRQLTGKVGPVGLNGLGYHPALVVRAIEAGLQQWRDHLDDLQAHGEKPRYKNVLLFVGPGLSNCDTAHFELDTYEMDDLRFGADGRKNPGFVDFIRDTILHGGFPFWNYCDSSLPWVPSPDYSQIRAILTEGLVEF